MIKVCLYQLLVLLLLTCAGCAVFVKEPRVSINSANIIGIDTSGLDLEFLMAVDNPNRFDLALQSYTFDLQVMTLPFSSGGSPVKHVFPAGKQSLVRLPMRIPYGNLIEIVKRRPDLDKIPYRVDARLNLETPLGELMLPVNKSDLISVPQSYRPGAYLKRFIQPLMERF